jgi:hypothetical protein
MTEDDERAAIERLAEDPGAVTGVCLQGCTVTAIDIIARASDSVIEEIVGVDWETERSQELKALRFMCGAFLKLRQAKRLTDMWEPRK